MSVSLIIPKPERDWDPPQLVDIGEDGQYIVGYGHIHGKVFHCLVVTHIATLAGLPAALDFVEWQYEEDPAGDVVHAWAVEKDPPAGSGADSWLCWDSDVTKDTPGAFPVTVLATEN